MISIQWGDELLYIDLVTRYGPQISCQRKQLTAFLTFYTFLYSALSHDAYSQSRSDSY